MKENIYNFTPEELAEKIKAMGEPAHRANQILLWLYSKNAGSFDVMTDLPKILVKELKARFIIGMPKWTGPKNFYGSWMTDMR